MRKTKTNPRQSSTTRLCTVTGVRTSENNFYKNQNHVKAVDNIRRNTGATKDQLKNMFTQLQKY